MLNVVLSITYDQILKLAEQLQVVSSLHLVISSHLHEQMLNCFANICFVYLLLFNDFLTNICKKLELMTWRFLYILSICYTIYIYLNSCFIKKDQSLGTRDDTQNELHSTLTGAHTSYSHMYFYFRTFKREENLYITLLIVHDTSLLHYFMSSQSLQMCMTIIITYCVLGQVPVMFDCNSF